MSSDLQEWKGTAGQSPWYSLWAGLIDEVQSELNLRAASAQESWVTPTLTNGWVLHTAGFDVGYFKDSTGMVHLRGRIKDGTIGQAAFTLPVGYRIDKAGFYTTTSNTAFGQLTVSATGAITPAVGSNSEFNLNGVSFRAG